MYTLVREKLSLAERMLAFSRKFVIWWTHLRQFQLELMQLWEQLVKYLIVILLLILLPRRLKLILDRFNFKSKRIDL